MKLKIIQSTTSHEWMVWLIMQGDRRQYLAHFDTMDEAGQFVTDLKKAEVDVVV